MAAGHSGSGRNFVRSGDKLVRDAVGTMGGRKRHISGGVQNDTAGSRIWRRHDVERYRFISWDHRQCNFMDDIFPAYIPLLSSRIIVQKNISKDDAPLSSVSGGGPWNFDGDGRMTE